MWERFLSAFALVLVFEGILPFLCPECWRDLIRKISIIDSQVLRTLGLVSMLSGVVLLYLVHS